MKKNNEKINLEKEIVISEKPKRLFKDKSNNNEFWDQYKDPRWQKKRLKIMERDEFMCTSCQDNGNTLNVHHKVAYRKNVKPWEYEDDELTTLCEICHKDISGVIDYCKNVIIGRCWCIDSAMETERIIREIDGMDPYELNAVWKLLKEAKKLR